MSRKQHLTYNLILLTPQRDGLLLLKADNNKIHLHDTYIVALPVH